MLGISTRVFSHRRGDQKKKKILTRESTTKPPNDKKKKKKHLSSYLQISSTLKNSCMTEVAVRVEGTSESRARDEKLKHFFYYIDKKPLKQPSKIFILKAANDMGEMFKSDIKCAGHIG